MTQRNGARQALATLLGGTLTASVASGAVYLVDFNDNGAGTLPANWNEYASAADVTGTLVDDGGGSSVFTISQTGMQTSSGSGYFNAGSAPGWVPAAAGNDYFWTGSNSTNTESFTVSFTGLTVGDSVSLDLFASRDSTGESSGFYEYSLDGGASWLGFSVLKNDGTPEDDVSWDGIDTANQEFHVENDGYVLGRYMNISDVELTGTSLQVRVRESATNFAGLNAMRLTVVPEPGSSLLLVGAGLLTGCRRRR